MAVTASKLSELCSFNHRLIWICDVSLKLKCLGIKTALLKYGQDRINKLLFLNNGVWGCISVFSHVSTLATNIYWVPIGIVKYITGQIVSFPFKWKCHKKLFFFFFYRSKSLLSLSSPFQFNPAKVHLSLGGVQNVYQIFNMFVAPCIPVENIKEEWPQLPQNFQLNW